MHADKVQSEGPPLAGGAVTVLVEEVVVDFDLGAGSEVVWQQHDGHGHLAQVVNLRMIKRIDASVKCGWVDVQRGDGGGDTPTE